MSEADGKGPTIVTKKWKRRSGFRYSTKKVLERSKLSREIAKGRVPELGSVKKALTYPSKLWSDIDIVDLGDFSTGSIGPASLHLVDENQEERIDASIGNIVSIDECSNKVSII
jgi:hypothetical protein